MERNQADHLQPRTLAWIEQTEGEKMLPVVWFGCLHGEPGQLLVGLRTGVSFSDDAARPGRFTLCWTPTGGGPGNLGQRAMMRLHCRNGRICDEYGIVTLLGQLEGVTVGKRAFSAGQVDFYRLLAVPAGADA